MQTLSTQPAKPNGGEDSFSLVPVFNGEANGRKSLISHSISGHFSIRQGPWKLCLSAGSGGWSGPQENVAKEQKLPPMQLFNLEEDKNEQQNLVDSNPERVSDLLKLLQTEVSNGRCTPGDQVPNDREVTFLPKGVSMP